MNKFYLLNYIKEINDKDNEVLYYLKYHLDYCIYHYGNHFASPREKDTFKKTKESTYLFLKRYYGLFIHNIRLLKKINNSSDYKIISTNHLNVANEFVKSGFNVYLPPWTNEHDLSLKKKRLSSNIAYIKKALQTFIFKDFFTEDFYRRIYELKEDLKEYYIKNNFSAVVFHHDVLFFERLTIQIFKELNRPSFVFLHGLPTIYTDYDNNQSDYLIVWGRKIKENFISAGVDEKKIFVSGHPFYNKIRPHESLRFDFSDILVLTRPMNHGQHLKDITLFDRGNLILYLFSVQNVLKNNGIKNVRLRPHPVENPAWYLQYIDANFFKIDNNDLSDSLNRSSLVIGPSSTIILDAVNRGINYVVYEPEKDGYNLLNFKSFNPFDGSDSRIPVAKNEGQLADILANRKLIDTSFFNDYADSPFTIDFIKSLIG